MFGVCPQCRTAYHWEFPRFGCQCGYMSDVPPPSEPERNGYSSLGRSPWSGQQPWNSDNGTNRRWGGTPRPATSGITVDSTERDRPRAEDRERERDRERKRREREEESWERRDRGRGRGRGNNNGGRRGRGR